MKKGDIAIMRFHYRGLVSESECRVISVRKGVVTLRSCEDHWKFDTKTGKCLNDNNAFGAYRTLAL